jgi:hypothetical protein
MAYPVLRHRGYCPKTHLLVERIQSRKLVALCSHIERFVEALGTQRNLVGAQLVDYAAILYHALSPQQH